MKNDVQDGKGIAMSHSMVGKDLYMLHIEQRLE